MEGTAPGGSHLALPNTLSTAGPWRGEGGVCAGTQGREVGEQVAEASYLSCDAPSPRGACRTRRARLSDNDDDRGRLWAAHALHWAMAGHRAPGRGERMRAGLRRPLGGGDRGGRAGDGCTSALRGGGGVLLTCEPRRPVVDLGRLLQTRLQWQSRAEEGRATA